MPLSKWNIKHIFSPVVSSCSQFPSVTSLRGYLFLVTAQRQHFCSLIMGPVPCFSFVQEACLVELYCPIQFCHSDTVLHGTWNYMMARISSQSWDMVLRLSLIYVEKKHWNNYLIPLLSFSQVLSTLTLLTFWTGKFLVVEVVLCIVGYLSASLASNH